MEVFVVDYLLTWGILDCVTGFLFGVEVIRKGNLYVTPLTSTQEVTHQHF